MGCGFLEDVYQECLEIEFERLRIPFESRPKKRLVFRSRTLRQYYRPDFICFNSIILELKVVSELMDRHRAQLINSLHTTGFSLGILLNFGSYPKLDYRRVAFTDKRRADSQDFPS